VFIAVGSDADLRRNLKGDWPATGRTSERSCYQRPERIEGPCPAQQILAEKITTKKPGECLW
jgi:hypothetical protein